MHKTVAILQVPEQSVEVMKEIPQERISEHILEVSQIQEHVVEVIKERSKCLNASWKM